MLEEWLKGKLGKQAVGVEEEVVVESVPVCTAAAVVSSTRGPGRIAAKIKVLQDLRVRSNGNQNPSTGSMRRMRETEKIPS